jgi:hypothetical protein
MIVDCNRYLYALRKCKNTIENIRLREITDTDLCQSLSLSTSIPLIVVCVYLMDQYGASRELTDLKHRLIEFYKYKEIIPFDYS